MADLGKMPALPIRSSDANSIVGFKGEWGILASFVKLRSSFLCTLMASAL
jgi:hypothetical protein